MKTLLGLNIKLFRKKKGLTQEQLAEKLGIKRSLLGAYEEGRAEPSLQMANRMANLFE
jgi:transcriptional regulator with XRE-family HTH domain